MDVESCSNCRFSDPRIGDDDEPYLACRRYPRQIVFDIVDGRPITAHPSVDSDDWCREWGSAKVIVSHDWPGAS